MPGRPLAGRGRPAANLASVATLGRPAQGGQDVAVQPIGGQTERFPAHRVLGLVRQRQQQTALVRRIRVHQRRFALFIVGREAVPRRREIVQLGQSREGIAQRHRPGLLAMAGGQQEQADQFRALYPQVFEEGANDVGDVEKHAAPRAAGQARDHVHARVLAAHRQAGLLGRSGQRLRVRTRLDLLPQARANQAVIVAKRQAPQGPHPRGDGRPVVFPTSKSSPNK